MSRVLGGCRSEPSTNCLNNLPKSLVYVGTSLNETQVRLIQIIYGAFHHSAHRVTAGRCSATSSSSSGRFMRRPSQGATMACPTNHQHGHVMRFSLSISVTCQKDVWRSSKITNVHTGVEDQDRKKGAT